MRERLPTFHDAAVQSIELEWSSGRVTCRLLTSEGPRSIVVLGVESLQCTRLQPWGPSVSVNEARAFPSPARVTLEIEMQTGDILRAEGREIIVE